MGTARVEIRETTVLKDYKDTDHHRWHNEIKAYSELSFATPRLLWSAPHWIEVERHTPILDLPKEESIKYKDQLWELLQKIHDSGYWHCDVDLVNVVVHPIRGVLLIDWENLMPSKGDISYDLYGAQLAGVDPAWEGKGIDGVSWRSASNTSPKNYWNL